MKNLSFSIILLFLLFSNLSCRQNRLKTDEKTLANEIYLKEKTIEKQETDRLASKKQESDSLSTLPNGIRYKENRSVEQSHPPAIIDIAGSLNYVKEFHLSDVSAEIRYIRIQPPPDSSFRKDIRFSYLLTDNNIIALNPFGMIQFTMDGKYVSTIVKNVFTNMLVTPEYVMSYEDMTFIGAFSSAPKISDNKLYYNYLNSITGQEYLMEYDCLEFQLSQTQKYNPENPDKILGSGKIIGDLNHGKAKYEPDKRHPGKDRYIIQAVGMNWIDDNYYMKKLKGDNMLAIFNKDGDTLSTFTQHEKLINYTKSLQRGVDSGEEYEFNGKTLFRNAFNDTVFQVIPPNRLLPLYVLNLGSFKVSKQQGVDPGFDLTGKIIPQDWAETDNFIFLTYVKDGYNCSNSRKNKAVKIYHAVYSKRTRQLSVLKGDPFDYKPEILENNIDGGVPVWPSSFNIGKNGAIMISLKGKELKERIKSVQFKNSQAPELKKNALKQLAASVSDYEDILMIVK